ncbi:MAG: hypothetical protein ACJ8ER_17165 [Allosphingosinicella sp.]
MVRKLLLLCLLPGLLAASAPPTAEEKTAAKEAMGADLGRYMETPADPRRPCTPVPAPVANWEDFPVTRCFYHASQANGPVLVVDLLDASRDRLVGWVASSCAAAGLKLVRNCYVNLGAHLKDASGYQFPVSGLVDESTDEDVCKSRLCYFTFRDGVAVSLPELDSKKQKPDERALQRFDLQSDQIVVLEGRYERPARYARIASTTVPDLVAWLRAHPEDRQSLTLSVAAGHWLDAQLSRAEADEIWMYPEVIRAAYQIAWSSDRNMLVDAWALANRECLRSNQGCDKPTGVSAGSAPRLSQ